MRCSDLTSVIKVVKCRVIGVYQLIIHELRGNQLLQEPQHHCCIYAATSHKQLRPGGGSVNSGVGHQNQLWELNQPF